MKKNVFFGFIFAFLTWEGSWAAQYQEYTLIEATSDLPQDMNYHSELRIRVNRRGHVMGIFKRDIPTTEDREMEEKYITYQEALEEAVLLEREERQIILLRLDQFDPELGGSFQLRFLRNGITERFETIHLNLVKYRGRWQVVTDQGEHVSKIFLKTNWYFLIGCVGISEIVTEPCQYQVPTPC